MPSGPETGPLSRAVLKPFTPPGMLILLAARQSGSLTHGQNPHSTMMTHLPVGGTAGEQAFRYGLNRKSFCARLTLF